MGQDGSGGRAGTGRVGSGGHHGAERIKGAGPDRGGRAGHG